MKRVGLAVVALLNFAAFGSALADAPDSGNTPTPPRVVGVRMPPDPKADETVLLKRADYPRESVAITRFAPIEMERVQRLLQKRNQPGPLQIGIARDLATESDSPAVPRLTWVQAGNGGQVARMEVTSPDAHALRVGIQVNAIPDGAELRFFGSADPNRIVGVVTARQVKAALVANSVYWTPHTDGATQTIEWYLPSPHSEHSLRIRLVGLSHLLTSAKEGFSLAKVTCNGGAGGPDEGCSQPCEHDVACIQNPSQDLLDSIAAVTQTEVVVGPGTVALCTATLLTDTVTSFTPYLYSANHCLEGQTANASTLNTFWFFQNAACSTHITLPSDFTQRVNGADVLYADPSSDVLLMRMRDTPPGGATFGGWDATQLTTGATTAIIHHPNGDVKKFSQGSVIGLISSFTDQGSGQVFNNLSAASFTSGIVESGSSGSALMTRDSSGNYFLRGGLLGGVSGLSCSAIGQSPEAGNEAAFSRFDLAFPHLQPYLAPSAAAFQITPGITGNWYDPAESGHGYGIEVLAGGVMLAEWYVFGPQGGQVWIVGTGTITGDSAVLQAFQGEGSGGRFPPNFNAALVQNQPWGTLTFTFTDCNNGTASWHPTAAGYTSGSIPITRLTAIAGQSCP